MQERHYETLDWWQRSHKLPPHIRWTGFTLSLICGVIFAYLVMRLYDEPIRAHLSAALARRNTSQKPMQYETATS